MSEWLIAALVFIGGIVVVAVIAAFRQVPFKAGLKTGQHEFSLELNSQSPEALVVKGSPSPRK